MTASNPEPGIFYIVATPIGNLADFTARAISVLSEVDRILAEDTREARQLLRGQGIDKPIQACHDHNEATWVERIIQALQLGESVALISDRGTPLISDPGYPLVVACHEAGFIVKPIPGACALITALSAAGLPTDRFCFEGFLPSKSSQREIRLRQLQTETRTLVFYEAPHRIHAMLLSLAHCFGTDRLVTIARELTKRFETIKRGTVTEILDYLDASPMHCKGEFVVCVKGNVTTALDVPDKFVNVEQLLKTLLLRHSVKEAAALTAELTGLKKNALYAKALTWYKE